MSKRETSSCKNCGEYFSYYPSASKGLYCSRICSIKHREGKLAANWRGGIRTSSCKHCQKPFKVKYLSDFKKRKFCSRACANALRAETVRGSNHHNWKPRIKKNCPFCGKSFSIRQSTKKTYCSIKCANTSAPLSGRNNHQWKGIDAGYEALHGWVKYHLGSPKECEHCYRTDLPSKRYHWANKSGDYKRTLGDWLRLCDFCHKAHDKELAEKGKFAHQVWNFDGTRYTSRKDIV